MAADAENPESSRYCRITGAAIPSYSGRGRPTEYASEAARELAQRLAQMQHLVNVLGPSMTPEKVRGLKSEFYRLGNQLNPWLKPRRGGPT